MQKIIAQIESQYQAIEIKLSINEDVKRNYQDLLARYVNVYVICMYINIDL